MVLFGAAVSTMLVQQTFGAKQRNTKAKTETSKDSTKKTTKPPVKKVPAKKQKTASPKSDVKK